MEKIDGNKRPQKDYLLIYDFEGNKELKQFAKEYAQRHHLKIYAIADTYPLLYANKNFMKAGPREFISMIYHCKVLFPIPFMARHSPSCLTNLYSCLTDIDIK